MMKTLATVALAIAAISGPALACAPAPTCWMQESREYLKSVCANYSVSGLRAENLDEPEQMDKFIRTCGKLGIKIKVLSNDYHRPESASRPDDNQQDRNCNSPLRWAVEDVIGHQEEK
jgi:hypothetical protein